jgi:hypothetical protein
MPTRLPAVLSRPEFAEPELGALILDGEVFRLDDCVAPVDELAGPPLRAAALAIELPPRLIAEQHTAAWVWGAINQPPSRLEVCADITARSRPPFDTRLSVREVVILHDDITVLSGVGITTPMRTAIDLARFVVTWNEEEARTVRTLITLGNTTVLECARVMNRRRNLPNKLLALERLASC